MDPITAIGVVASVLQIASNCGRTLQSLSHLKARFKNAGSTLDALTSEVNQVRDNLTTLKGILEDKDHSFAEILKSRPDLQETVAKTLRGCDLMFKLLSRDLAKILSSSAETDKKLDIIRITKFTKNEKIFKEYLTQIRGHQTALSMLCQMLQMYALLIPIMEWNLSRHRQSLNDITKLLRVQQAVLAEQSTIMKRTWSITELSDSDTVVSEGSAGGVALFDDLPPDSTAYPGSPPLAQPSSQEMARQTSRETGIENLIDLDDDGVTAPSNGSDEPNGHPAHLEDMRSLNPSYFKGKSTQADEDTSKIVYKAENRDSTQTMSTLPSVIVDSEEKIVVPTKSLHERPTSGSSAATPRRVSEQSIASLQELRSRDSIASSLPEVIMEIDEFFPKVINPHAYLPPLAQDVEANLESRLPNVQHTQDQSLQLQWAEEVLQFIGSDASRRNPVKKQVASPTKLPTTADTLHIEAKTIVEILVHKGHPKAMFLKARWIETDPQLALRDFLNALARGYLRAAFYVGTSYEQEKKNHKTAVGYFKQGCDGGDSASRGRMALAYLRGELGLKRNHDDAIRLLLQAAATADSDAPDSLSVLAKLQTKNYRHVFKIKEKLLPIDIRAARDNFFKAAKLGDVIAQVTLGRAYLKQDNDLQVPVDPALSLHYLRLASRQGMPEADLHISTSFWFGHSIKDSVIVPQNHELAFRYAYRAMKYDYAPAYCQVGYFYEHGLGVKQNYDKAKDCYIKAISKGDPDATKRYDAFINKYGVERKQKEKEGMKRRATGMSSETLT